MKKRCFCCNCGVDLGIVETWPGDLIDCGLPDCVRETQSQERERDDNARMDAEQDNFDRYR